MITGSDLITLIFDAVIFTWIGYCIGETKGYSDGLKYAGNLGRKALREFAQDAIAITRKEFATGKSVDENQRNYH